MSTQRNLSEIFVTPQRRKAIDKLLGGKSLCTSAYALAGSAPALLFAGMTPRQSPTLIIGDSLDDAGYLYHDLSRILGEEAVLMFPSGYKRDIKYGQIDAPSQILRTEVLNNWHTNPLLRYVITYPDAIAERVASKETIARHTLRLKQGDTVDPVETINWLRDNGFIEVDYVYEPGHFALRGSILDIFGYSNELPYRIDFFGDEIDSMRTFNIETQLSQQRLDDISITSNVAQHSHGDSLLNFIGDDTLIAVRDAQYTLSRIREIAGETFSESSLIANEGDRNAMNQVVDADEFTARFSQFRQLRFSASAQPDSDAKASIDLCCSPQGIYHKNFDLISEDFKKMLAEGYTLYILSDSEK